MKKKVKIKSNMKKNANIMAGADSPSDMSVVTFLFYTSH